MKPVILLGREAFSRFRVDAMLKSLRERTADSRVAELEAVFVYLVQTDSPLSPTLLDKCFALLTASAELDAAVLDPSGADGFLVTPRKGTISPWSSKATDIFHNCGINGVVRVERGIRFRVLAAGGGKASIPIARLRLGLNVLHDRMTEGVYTDVSDIFDHLEPRPFVSVDIAAGGRAELEKANTAMGLALSGDEIDYLYAAYRAAGRNPTDVELVMFGQVNSEHCRHKIFKADWILDGQRQPLALFDMIRNTHRAHPGGTLVAYADNAAVVEGFKDWWFGVARDGERRYEYAPADVDLVMKVETHNHPTAISPYPGAATGVGGEIRDEAATGIGGRSKAGLSGFVVSNLRIPGFVMPWEKDYAEFPSRLATPLQIMTEGPLGGAGFGNEFGRPQLCGMFKTFEERCGGRYRGYHKPIMIAGGMGALKRIHCAKKEIGAGAAIIQLGGPAMRIGLGGGAASSMATGSNVEALDFDSVQRDNAEMQRRCQEVIEACIAMGPDNPILSVHDLGAGGLSNGCPELIAETGGKFWLRKVHNEEKSMSPMEIWCCEAQERYVLAVPHDTLDNFVSLCARERCPVAVIGEATGDGRLTLHDEHFGNNPIDIELQVILGKPPRMLRDVKRSQEKMLRLDFGGMSLDEATGRVLRLPAVARKTFLITIADRTVMGMTARDQMVGPFQVPLSDVAVITTSYKAYTGSAMAMGERTAVAVVSGPASGRMAVGEALTNICAADVGRIGNVKLSANWMCACGEEGEDAALYETVKAVGMEFCPALGVSIPVGKDSLSMRTLWDTSDGRHEKVVSPLSLIVSSFAPVRDVRRTVTPDLKRAPASSLLLLDLGRGRNRAGCSALARVYNRVGSDHPDVDDPGDLVAFFAAVQELVSGGLLLAYHDRADGGLFATLAEMAIAGRTGLRARLDGAGDEPLAAIFAEELGAVIQVADRDLERVREVLGRHGVTAFTHELGRPTDDRVMTIERDGRTLLARRVSELDRAWSELTYRMQARRDNPDCAKEEYDALLDEKDPGMSFKVSFDPAWAPAVVGGARPKVAILREQGINGHVEMAAAFDRAGFTSVDVHMTDLLAGRARLGDFAGLVACGGFSYGDVLGAGSGWAKSILYNEGLKDEFAGFFARPGTFTLGVCNGCQMVAQLKDIIPGAGDWPRFSWNRSERFEARYVTVEVLRSPSVLLAGMEGSVLGIPVAHGEGRMDFSGTGSQHALEKAGLLAMRYVDNRGKPAELYPLNPNGSPGGLTGLASADGRATIMMPHPERAFRAVQLSYRPAGVFEGEDGPWMRMFRNALAFAQGS